MPFPLVPFVAGAVAGALATYVMRDRLPQGSSRREDTVKPDADPGSAPRRQTAASKSTKPAQRRKRAAPKGTKRASAESSPES